MRILYISVAYPLPANNGSKMRLWAVLRAIAAGGHRITLASFAEPEEVAGTEDELRKICPESDVVPLHYTRLSEGGSYVDRLRAIFSPLPFSIHRFRSPEMRARLERRLRERDFDVIVCDNVYSAINLPAGASPIVMNSQNVEYVILQRYLQQESNPAKALYARLEAAKLRRFEATMYGRAVLGMACSSTDARQIEELCPGLKVAVAPNVVDPSEYEGDFGGEDARTILYQGGMDWFPNRDALEFFVRQILPLIRKEVPDAKLIAAGRNPSPEFRARFADVKDLEFTGTVPDLRPMIARATVAVVPLRIGSGTRLKILEGGCMRKAMVSTSIGAEGLDFVDGQEILIADEPVKFAAAVVSLLRNPARRQTLGEAARLRVLHDYDNRALERLVSEALNDLQQTIRSGAGSRQLASALG